jgi:two-component system response regulator DctR
MSRRSIQTRQGLSDAFISKFAITNREREVVEEIVEGKSNKEIAQDLNIDVRTIEVHLRNIYQKVGVRDRFALFALLLRH